MKVRKEQASDTFNENCNSESDDCGGVTEKVFFSNNAKISA
jgi:hypothetical protein